MDYNEQMYTFGDDEGNLVNVVYSDIAAFNESPDGRAKYSHTYTPYIDDKGALGYAKDGEDETDEWRSSHEGWEPARVYLSGDAVAKKDTMEWLKAKYPSENIENIKDKNVAKLAISIGRHDLVNHDTMVDLGLHDNVGVAAAKGAAAGTWEGAKGLSSGALRAVGGLYGLVTSVGGVVPDAVIGGVNAVAGTDLPKMTDTPLAGFDNFFYRGSQWIDKHTDYNNGANVSRVVGEAVPHILLSAATMGGSTAATAAAATAAKTGAGAAARYGTTVGNAVAKAVMAKAPMAATEMLKRGAILSAQTASQVGTQTMDVGGTQDEALLNSAKAFAVSLPGNVVTSGIVPNPVGGRGVNAVKNVVTGAIDAGANMGAVDIAMGDKVDYSTDDYLKAMAVGGAVGGVVGDIVYKKSRAAFEHDVVDPINATNVGGRFEKNWDGSYKWVKEQRVGGDVGASPVTPDTPLITGAADVPTASSAVVPDAPVSPSVVVPGGSEVSTVAPAVSTVTPAVPTVAPAVSTVTPEVSTVTPEVSTVTPAVPTVAPVAPVRAVDSAVLDNAINPDKLVTDYASQIADKSAGLSSLVYDVYNGVRSVHAAGTDDAYLMHETYSYLVNKLGLSEERAALEMYDAFPYSFAGPNYSDDALNSGLVSSQNAEWQLGAAERVQDMRAYGRGEKLPQEVKVSAMRGSEEISLDDGLLVHSPEHSVGERIAYVDVDSGELVYFDKTTYVDPVAYLDKLDAEISSSVVPNNAEIVAEEISQSQIVGSAVDNYVAHEGIAPFDSAVVSSQKQTLIGSSAVGGVVDANPAFTGAESVRQAARREEVTKAFGVFQRAMNGESISDADLSSLTKVVDDGVPMSVIHKELVGNPKMQWPIRGCVIKTPADVAGLTSMIRNPYQEMSKIIWLNEKGQVIDARITALGINDATYVNMHGSFENIPKGAKYFIHSHNHPSGVTTPSPEDWTTRMRLRRMAKEMGVEMLDDIITNGHSYYSFAQNVDDGSDKSWTALSKHNADIEYPSDQPKFDPELKADWEVAQLGKLVHYNERAVRKFAEMLSTHNSKTNWYVAIGNHDQVYGIVKAADTVAERVSQLSSFGVNTVIEIVGTKGDPLAASTMRALDGVITVADVVRINSEGVAISAPLSVLRPDTSKEVLSKFASEEVTPRYISESAYAPGEMNHDVVVSKIRYRGEIASRVCRDMPVSDIVDGNGNIKGGSVKPSTSRIPPSVYDLVQISKYLSSSGAAPTISKYLGKGVVSRFSHKVVGKTRNHVPGSGKIFLEASLFKVVPEAERQAIRSKVADSISKRSFVSEEAKVAALEAEYNEELAKRTAEALKEDLPQVRKALAREIGHWLDCLPDMPSGRGGVLPRIYRLHKYSKQYMVPAGAEDLSIDEKRLIDEQVRATYPMRDGLSTVEKEQIKLLRRNYRRTLTDEKLRAKGCLVAGDIKNEMMALAAWNRDVPACPQDIARSSSKLFNEAFSVWLNYPTEVATRAPLYDLAMQKAFAADPVIKRVLDTLDEEIAKTAKRTEGKNIAEYFAEQGEIQSGVSDISVSAIEAAANITATSKLWAFWSSFVNMEKPFTHMAQYMPTEGIKEEFLTNLYRYSGDPSAYQERALVRFADVMKILSINNVSYKKFNGFLEEWRIAYDVGRRDVANPNGKTPEMCRRNLEAYKAEFPEEYAVLEQANAKFREWMKKYFLEEVKKSNVFAPEMVQLLEDRYLDYVHFSTERLGKELERLTMGLDNPFNDHVIRASVGTFRNVAEVSTATVAHLTAIVRKCIRDNRAYGILENALKGQEYNPLVKDDKDRILKEVVPLGQSPKRHTNKSSHRTIVVMHEGRLIAYHVPRVLENFFNPAVSDTFTELVTGSVVNWANAAKPFSTVMNASWAIANLVRDLAETNLTLPVGKNAKVIRGPGFALNFSYLEEFGNAWKEGYKRLKGELTPEAEKAIERGIAVVANLKYGTMQQLLKSTHPESASTWKNFVDSLVNKEFRKAFKAGAGLAGKPVLNYLDFFLAAEYASKRAGIAYMDKYFPDTPEVYKLVTVAKHAGSPWAWSRAFITKMKTVDAFLWFTNTILQGTYEVMDRFRLGPVMEYYAKPTGGIGVRPKKGKDGKWEYHKGGYVQDGQRGARWKNLLWAAVPSVFVALMKSGAVLKSADESGMDKESETYKWLARFTELAQLMSWKDVMRGRIPLWHDGDGKLVMFKMPETSVSVITGQIAAWLGYAAEHIDDAEVRTICPADIIAAPIRSILNRSPMIAVLQNNAAWLDAAAGGDGTYTGMPGYLAPQEGQLDSNLGFWLYSENIAKDTINVFTGRGFGLGGLAINRPGEKMTPTQELLYGKWRPATFMIRPFIAVSDSGFREMQNVLDSRGLGEAWVAKYMAKEAAQGRTVDTDEAYDPEVYQKTLKHEIKGDVMDKYDQFKLEKVRKMKP